MHDEAIVQPCSLQRYILCYILKYIVLSFIYNKKKSLSNIEIICQKNSWTKNTGRVKIALFSLVHFYIKNLT